MITSLVFAALIWWVLRRWSLVLATAAALGWLFLADLTVRRALVAWWARTRGYGTDERLAAELFEARPDDGLRFVLYLRGFHRESTYLREEDRYGWDSPHYTDAVTGRHLERMLLRFCHPDLAVAGLANIHSAHRLAGILWLDPGPIEWQTVVRRLISHAHRVVIYMNNPTPGLETELRMLEDAGAFDRTALLVSPEVRRFSFEPTPAGGPQPQVLDVPSRDLPWWVVLLAVLLGIVGWRVGTPWNVLGFLLPPVASGARNELRAARFARRLRQHVRGGL